MTRSSLRRQVVRFLVVGLGGTAAYLAVYLLLRTGMAAQPANLTARLAVALVTTWLNARYTFRARVSARRLYGGALAVLAAGAAVSAGVLAVEQLLLGPADRLAEVGALAVANAAATAARFVLLRQWLFGPAIRTAGAQPAPGPGPAGRGTTDRETTATVPPRATVRTVHPLRGET